MENNFDIHNWQAYFLKEGKQHDIKKLKDSIISVIESQLDKIHKQADTDTEAFKYQTTLYSVKKKLE